MTIEDVLNETYIVEKTAEIILKLGILGNVIMYGSVNGKKGEKPMPFNDLPEGLKRRILTTIQKDNPEIEDVEKYVKKQSKPIKFFMVGGRLRLTDDGKIKKPKSLSDMELRGKYSRA